MLLEYEIWFQCYSVYESFPIRSRALFPMLSEALLYQKASLIWELLGV